ncbi:MAG: hypothetical protein K0S07_331 [Chlamydiales bacterium]|jgi:hypothetical protein|nr:hypothetical protein [Chlamydiales bacterium]
MSLTRINSAAPDKTPSFSSFRLERSLLLDIKNYPRFLEIFWRCLLEDASYLLAKVTGSEKIHRFSKMQGFKIGHLEAKVHHAWGRFVLKDDLIVTCRNIAKVEVAEEGADVERARALFTQKGAEEVAFEGMITDGVCFGASVEFLRLCHQRSAGGPLSSLEIEQAAAQYERGVSADAAALQAIYNRSPEAMPDPLFFSAVFEGLMPLLLNLQQRVGADQLNGLTAAEVRLIFGVLGQIKPFQPRKIASKMAPLPLSAGGKELVNAIREFCNARLDVDKNSRVYHRVSHPEFKKAFMMASSQAVNISFKSQLIAKTSGSKEKGLMPLKMHAKVDRDIYRHLPPYAFCESSKEQLQSIETLPPGSYLLDFATGSGFHQIALIQGSPPYLFDPGYGLILCSEGLRKTVLKMLSLYPRPQQEEGAASKERFDPNYRISIQRVSQGHQRAARSSLKTKLSWKSAKKSSLF